MHQSAARGEATPSIKRPVRASLGSRPTIILASVIAALLFGVIGVVGPFSVGAQSSDADNYVSRINALRSSVGAQSLSVDGELTGLAQSCAERIAAAGALVHTSNLSAGISSAWTKLGENIGMGPRNDTIWTAFVQSAQHYANLVDPAFNRGRHRRRPCRRHAVDLSPVHGRLGRRWPSQPPPVPPRQHGPPHRRPRVPRRPVPPLIPFRSSRSRRPRCPALRPPPTPSGSPPCCRPCTC